MNIEGFAFKNNRDIQSISDLAKTLNLEIRKREEVFWSDYESGFFSENQIIILQEKQGFIVYPSQEVLERKENNYIKLLMNSESGFTFALNETSMLFLFNWFEKNKESEEDVYDFMQDENKIIGNNKLNLSTESDVIFDGFFPYLKTFLETIIEGKKATICSYDFFENTSKLKKESQKLTLAKKVNYSDMAEEVLFQKKVKNGIEEIYKLRNIFIESLANGGKPPKDFNMDYIKNIPVKKVKSEIRVLSREWEFYGVELSEFMFLKIIKVALAWGLYNFEPKDLKRKWWKFK